MNYKKLWIAMGAVLVFSFAILGDSGREITAFSFDVRVEPGRMVNPGKVSLKRYGPGVRYIYVAIAQVRLEDGEVIDIPAEKQAFFYWTVDE